MRRVKRTTMATLLGGSALLALYPGCVERNETITVHSDGSVAVAITYEGTEEQLGGPDAMPSPEAGWPVERTIKEERDKIKHILHATRLFEPRDQVPHNFAPAGDPDADLYLQFPTSVRVERRPDGVYYYFRRVYESRPWAYVQYWNDLCIDDEVKQLGEKDVESLTVKERAKIVEALVCAEALKQAEFADIAARTGKAGHPEDRLRARQALLDVYEDQSELYETITRQCQPLDEPEREACFNRESERMLAEGYNAYVDSLRRDSAWNDRRVAAFEQAFHRARKRHDITADLGGHVFEIDVWMPGEIVTHNALDPKLDQDGDMSRIRFQFDGKAFRDRPHELLVVSRRPNG